RHTRFSRDWSSDVCSSDLNQEAVALYIDFWILGDAAREFPNDSWEKHRALAVGNEIVNAFKKGDQESIKKCRKLAQQIIGDKVEIGRASCRERVEDMRDDL